jgi:hypothetical protein
MFFSWGLHLSFPIITGIMVALYNFYIDFIVSTEYDDK